MATGPEHYREAEAHLAIAARNFLNGDEATNALAAAQVHATLALAAATAEANPEIADYLPHDKRSVLPWLDVLIAERTEESE